MLDAELPLADRLKGAVGTRVGLRREMFDVQGLIWLRNFACAILRM